MWKHYYLWRWKLWMAALQICNLRSTTEKKKFGTIRGWAEFICNATDHDAAITVHFYKMSLSEFDEVKPSQSVIKLATWAPILEQSIKDVLNILEQSINVPTSTPIFFHGPHFEILKLLQTWPTFFFSCQDGPGCMGLVFSLTVPSCGANINS